MFHNLKLEEGDYPFIAERIPLSDLAWVEAPPSLEALIREQAKNNNVQLIRGLPVELRCVSEHYGDAVFMIYWPNEEDRLHMLTPKKFQIGKS